MKIFSRLLTEQKILLKKLRYTRRPHTAKIHTPFKTQNAYPVTLFNGTTKRKQNIDVIADLATNYIRPAVNVCSL